MSWRDGFLGGAAAIGVAAATGVLVIGAPVAGVLAAGTPGISPAAGVTYQVSVAAQRAALAFWTPSRMRMTGPQAWPELRDGPELPQAEVTPPKGIPTAVKFAGVRTAGALFFTTGGRRHFCTAEVVNSTAGDLVLTAAHCVYSTGYATNIAYVPEYHNGQRPFGTWAVRTITVASGWRKSHDPDHDFAVLAVGAAAGPKIHTRTGGLTIGFNRWYTENKIQVIGHNDTDDEPVHCGTRSFRFRTGQMEFYCHGYYTGTSGGPWILNFNAKTGAGTVYGIIGGYDQGGKYDWASYSPYFGSAAHSLYQLAERPVTPPPSPSPSPSASSQSPSPTATATATATASPSPTATPTPTPTTT